MNAKSPAAPTGGRSGLSALAARPVQSGSEREIGLPEISVPA